MEKAIRNAKNSKMEYSRSEIFSKKNNDIINAEIEMRKADQHIGYAEGINQALVTLGVKHDRMKELSELL